MYYILSNLTSNSVYLQPITNKAKSRTKMSLELSEQELVRRDSLQKLKDEGIEPFPAALFPVDTLSKEVRENYEEGKKVIIAGRLMSKNIMGKASFSSIQDSEGRIQAYFNRDILCPDEDKKQYNLVTNSTP